MTVTITTHSEHETMLLAQRLVARLHPGDCVLLEGPLGSGKTCFVRGLVRGLGLNPAQVSSPTFTICQTYGTDEPTAQPRFAVHHIDAYRLHGADELESIGFDEMLERGDAVIVIEWPSIIESALPDARVMIEFGHVDETIRELRVEPRGLPAERMIEIEDACRRPLVSDSPCPSCSQSTSIAAPSYPFCSERCRLADLGGWFSGRYTVSRAMEFDDLDEFAPGS